MKKCCSQFTTRLVTFGHSLSFCTETVNADAREVNMNCDSVQDC